MITLSLEPGTGRWIPEALQAAGIHSNLVFVWISGIMILYRYFAGPFVKIYLPARRALYGIDAHRDRPFAIYFH